jgi:hypothetical protein
LYILNLLGLSNFHQLNYRKQVHCVLSVQNALGKLEPPDVSVDGTGTIQRLQVGISRLIPATFACCDLVISSALGQEIQDGPVTWNAFRQAVRGGRAAAGRNIFSESM